MFPGLTSKLSEDVIALADTIRPLTDIIRITDTTSTTVLTTILPSFSGFSGLLIVLNDSGNTIASVTTGNIQRVAVLPVSMAVLFVYSFSAGKWYPGAIS